MMRRIIKWVGTISVLLGIGIVGLVVYFRRSLPMLSGQVAVAGVSRPVKIVRDRHAVPHVDAQTAADVAFGLGYVHAQDRLWQLEMNRRLGSGTLSEVFGKKTLTQDRLFRTLGLRRIAQENLSHLDVETHAVLNAYARGINAFLENKQRVLPPEFVILGVEPRAWVPADSLVCLKVMAWILSGNWKTELLRVRLGRNLTPKQISEFLGGESLPSVDVRTLYSSLDPAAEALMSLKPSKNFAASMGSNNWVVDGSRTLTGKPLLANDPHLDLTAPPIWYLAHLHTPSFNVIGATLLGLPTVILGRNDRVAWAFTNTESDTQDLFVEKLDPGDPTRYVTPTGTGRFTSAREVIKVKGAADEVLDVRISRHGPIISRANRAPE